MLEFNISNVGYWMYVQVSLKNICLRNIIAQKF